MNEAVVNVVIPKVTDEEISRIMSDIERIAYEIAQEGEADGLREVDAG